MIPVAALAPVLLQAAPFLANLIFGDKTGAVVQQAANIAGAALGVPDAANNPAALQAALAKANPDKMIELQGMLAKFAHEQEMAKIDAANKQRADELQELRAHIDNTAGARNQTVELAKLGHALAWAPAIVSFIVLGTFGIVLYMVLNEKIPTGQERIADTMIGILGTLAVACVQYWVGSSRGSARKDELLALAPPVAPPMLALPKPSDERAALLVEARQIGLSVAPDMPLDGLRAAVTRARG